MYLAPENVRIFVLGHYLFSEQIISADKFTVILKEDSKAEKDEKRRKQNETAT